MESPAATATSRHHLEHRPLHGSRRCSQSLYGPDHQLHRQVSRRISRFGLGPGLESDSRAQRSHSETDSPRAHHRHSQRIAVCLWRADQLEWRRSFPPPMFSSTAAGRANRRAQPRHFSAHGHQSQSRIGQRPSAFHEGWPRPGRSARSSRTPAPTSASRTH